MVFSACGKDEDSGGAASQPELTLVYNDAVNTPTDATTTLQALIVTWTGADGYDYDVYFEQRNAAGVITSLDGQAVATSSGIKGQTLFALKVKTGTDNKPAAPWWELDNPDAAEKNLWSIALGTGTPAHYYGNSDGSTIDGYVTGVFGNIATEVVKGVGAAKATPRTTYYRIGVAAANPGGYPIAEKRTVVYSEWF